MERFDGLLVGKILEQGAQDVPDKVAVVDGDRRLTYRQLNDMSDALASGFQELGFKKGDRIAIYMKSSVEFITAFYAL